MSIIRILGLGYAAMFFFVAFMGYIPAFLDDQGNLFGLFTLDMYDNTLHATSGVWALIAALISNKQIILYFKIFGSVYFLDSIIGLYAGNSFLDFGIFIYGMADNSFLLNFFLNVPHVFIGGIAMFFGFYLSRKTWATKAR
ncbi:MAG: DUF4383 domain-containing protein [Patescibacteria group bacterium]